MQNTLNIIENALRQSLANEKTQYSGRIYHYTSPEGIKGILTQNEIWFSNTKFLNDSTENNYIYSLFPKYPDIYKEVLLEKYFFDLIRKVADSYLQKDWCYLDDNVWWADNIYVASFSKSKDNLGLWNYYTKNSNSVGYNLGFDYIPFNISSNELKYIHGEVIYDKKKQVKLLKEIILQYNKIFKDYKNDIETNQLTKNNFIKSFIDIIELYNIFFKNPAFRDEQEYRCAIYNVINYAGIMPETRIIDGVFIPYLKIRYDLNALYSIGISPSNNKELLQKGIEFFLKTKSIYRPEIWCSKIPKRY